MKHALRTFYRCIGITVIWLDEFTSSLHVHRIIYLYLGQATMWARTRGKLHFRIYRAFPVGYAKRKQITCSPETEIFHFYFLKSNGIFWVTHTVYRNSKSIPSFVFPRGTLHSTNNSVFKREFSGDFWWRNQVAQHARFWFVCHMT